MGACASKPKVLKNEDAAAPENVGEATVLAVEEEAAAISEVVVEEEAAAISEVVVVEEKKEMIDSGTPPPEEKPQQQADDEVTTIQDTEVEVMVIKEVETNPSPEVELEKMSINEVHDANSETNLTVEAETEKANIVDDVKEESVPKLENKPSSIEDKIEADDQNKKQGKDNNPIASFISSLMGQKR